MKIVFCKLHNGLVLFLIFLLSLALSGCGGAYRGVGNLTQVDARSQANTLPVVVKPGCVECQAVFNQVLPLCLAAAEKGQYGESQKAELRTLTGVVGSVGQGAAAGLEVGQVLDSAGFDTSAGESALVGATAGLVGGLASAFASGAEETSEAVTRILKTCMSDHSEHPELGRMWSVY